MKKALIILLLINLSFVKAQTQKPTYYFDVNDTKISEKLYLAKYRNKKDSTYYHSITLENDTCFVQKLVKNKGRGRLNESDFKKLNLTLNRIDPSNFKKFSIIKYHPGKDRCNGGRALGYGFKPGFYKKLKKKYNLSIFWLHKIDTSVNFISNRGVNWITDTNKVLEKLFFRYHYPCGSFVVINNKTKNYMYFFGEHGDITILDILNKMMSKS